MDFRAFHVVAIEVTRQAMAENGGKWQSWVSARFLLWTSRWAGRQWPKMAENGRKRVAAGKWQEMDFRVFHVVAIEVEKRRSGKKWWKMVEKGLPRENGRKWISACFTSFPYYCAIYKKNRLSPKSEVDECEYSAHSSCIADGQRSGLMLRIARRMWSNTFTVHRVMCRLFTWWNRCKQRFVAIEASLRTLRSADSEIRMESENSGMISFRELVEQQCDEEWMNGENVHRWVALRQNGENW